MNKPHPVPIEDDYADEASSNNQDNDFPQPQAGSRNVSEGSLPFFDQDSGNRNSKDSSVSFEEASPRAKRARRFAPALIVAAHHVVLILRNLATLTNSSSESNDANVDDSSVTAENVRTAETPGTRLLHDVLREKFPPVPDQVDSDSQKNRGGLTSEECDLVLRLTTDAIRNEHTAIPADTPLFLSDRPDDWEDHSTPTHTYNDASPPTLGVIANRDRLRDALRFYQRRYHRRIPVHIDERRAWVTQIEDMFCAWQLQHMGAESERIENLRLAIQFIRKWLAKRVQSEVTNHMVTNHLSIIQKGWEAVQKEEPSMTTTAAATATGAAWNPRDLPHAQSFFEGPLPTDRDERVQYVRNMEENYLEWKEKSPVSSKMRVNLLQAFEKLLRHTIQWLTRPPPMDARTQERTIAMFLGLLKDRWLEFLEKTDFYMPMLAGDRRPPGFFETTMDASDNSCMAVASYLFLNPNAMSLPETETPVQELQLDMSGEADDNVSQISIPFAVMIDANPLRSDATKGLFFAVEEGNMDKVMHFIAQGATVHGLDEFEETVYHRAAAVGKMDVLEHLRLWGANPNSRNMAGEIPALVACAHGHVEAAEFLLRHQFGHHGTQDKVSFESYSDTKGRTLLHHAAWHGHITVVRALMDMFGSDTILNLTDQDGLTARHYARLGGHTDMEKFLEEQSAPVGMGFNDDALSFDPTSLHDACATGRLNLVQWIVEGQYPDMFALDDQGRTPLDCARARSGNDQVVAYLQDCLDVKHRTLAI